MADKVASLQLSTHFFKEGFVILSIGDETVDHLIARAIDADAVGIAGEGTTSDIGGVGRKTATGKVSLVQDLRRDRMARLHVRAQTVAAEEPFAAVWAGVGFATH